MKNSNTMLALLLVGVGATGGYLAAKKQKDKKPLNKTIAGALAGGLVGLLTVQLRKETPEEKKLTIPTSITIERT